MLNFAFEHHRPVSRHCYQQRNSTLPETADCHQQTRAAAGQSLRKSHTPRSWLAAILANRKEHLNPLQMAAENWPSAPNLNLGYPGVLHSHWMRTHRLGRRNLRLAAVNEVSVACSGHSSANAAPCLTTSGSEGLWGPAGEALEAAPAEVAGCSTDMLVAPGKPH